MFNTKYIFRYRGVTSSLGKGIMASSLALLLKLRGYSVTIQKLDPYLNVDPGTLNPYEHGECFVTEDGAETLTLDIMNVLQMLEHLRLTMLQQAEFTKPLLKKKEREIILGERFKLFPHVTDEIKKKNSNTWKHQQIRLCNNRAWWCCWRY